MAKAFQEREYQDSRMVFDVLIELIESQPGSRPLRVPVGDDSRLASIPLTRLRQARRR
jgi:hypothetical protein